MILAAMAWVAVAQTEPRQSSAAQPIELPSSWFSADDYPKEAAGRGAQGTARFRLTVDTNGQPTACQIVESSRDASLDEITCASALSRARFRPARNELGIPVEGSYVSRVNWALPTAPYLIASQPVRIVNRLTAGPGNAVTCETISATNAVYAGYGCNMEYNHFEVREFARLHRGREVQLSDSIGFAPGTAPFPTESDLVLGERYAQLEAHLRVNPGGVVVGCSIARSTGSAPRRLTLPDMCAYYIAHGRSIFAPVPTLVAPRTVRVTHDYYLRLSRDGDPKPD